MGMDVKQNGYLSEDSNLLSSIISWLKSPGWDQLHNPLSHLWMDVLG